MKTYISSAAEALKEPPAQCVLVPVDGSDNALNAVGHAIRLAKPGAPVFVHLLYVQRPLWKGAGRAVTQEAWAAHVEERSSQALDRAVALLEAAGTPYSYDVLVGEVAACIAEFARRIHCDRIVMGSARDNGLQRLMNGSVTLRVLETADVPVEIIPGAPTSRAVAYGMPAAIGAGLVATYLAVQ